MSLLLPTATAARCESVADVAAALAHAREHEIEPALDLSPLNQVVVDPMRRIAWVQPGVLWGELDAATQEHGLAVTGGRSPSTGVAALTLGSGSGWLERRMGLAADNLRAARVLTADGRVVLASAQVNPDLFWALRGGGGSFGIAVELEFALRPVGPEVLGGMLQWPRERAGDVMRAYRELMAGAPDALCGGLVLTRPTVGVLVLYAGDAERGADHLRPLRELAPALDTVRPRPYCELQAMHAGGDDRIEYLDALDDATIDALIDAPAALLQPLGGAYGRVGELETAHGHRAAAWGVQAPGALAGTLAPSPEREHRLLAAKARWDPQGVFAYR
jgi:FAD/FMN-containing dehydrogenase